MMQTLRNFALRILFGAAMLSVLTGCRQDDGQVGSDSDSASVVLTLGVSVSGGSVDAAADAGITRALTTDQERAIFTMKVLVFDADTDTYCYTAHVSPKGSGEYRILLDKPTANTTEKLYMVLLANLDDATMALLPTYVNKGETRAVVLGRLRFESAGRWPAGDADPTTGLADAVKVFPMWYQTEPFSITAMTKEEDVKLKTASMLRAVATLRMKVNAAPIAGNATFIPTRLHVYHAVAGGLVVPDPAKLSAGQATAPTLPATLTYCMPDPLVYMLSPTAEYATTGAAYLIESPAGTNKSLFCVLEGDYDDGTTDRAAFYRIDMKDAVGSALPILRNHRYTIAVTINGPGASSADDAIAAPSAEAVLTVRPWTVDATDDDSTLDVSGTPVKVKLKLTSIEPTIVAAATRAADSDLTGARVVVMQYLDGVFWNRAVATNPVMSGTNTCNFDVELLRPSTTKEQRIVVLCIAPSGSTQEQDPTVAGSKLADLYKAYSVFAVATILPSSGLSSVVPNLTEGSTLEVKMVRASARVDVGMGLNSSDKWTSASGTVANGTFTMAGLWIYNAFNRTSLVPDLSATNSLTLFAGGEVSWPSLPSWRSSYKSASVACPLTGGKISLENYVGEAVSGESYLIVKGTYKEPYIDENNPGTTFAESYYRIDLAQDNKALPLLRNHRYIVNITDVSGKGADSPEKATSENITAEIIITNKDNSTEVITDGHYYLGVSRNPLYFDGLGNPTENASEVTLSTNHNAWAAALTKSDGTSTSWFRINSSGAGQGINQNFLWADGGKVAMNLSGKARYATYKVQAGNLEREVSIVQTSISPEDFKLDAKASKECACYETSVPLKVYVAPVFAAMPWSVATSTTASGFTFGVSPTSGVFGGGTEEGKAYGAATATFGSVNTTAIRRQGNALFRLTYSGNTVETNLPVYQKSAAECPMKVLVTKRQRWFSWDGIGYWRWRGIATGVANTYEVLSGTQTVTIDHEASPSMSYSSSVGWGNTFAFGYYIQLASDSGIPSADIQVTNNSQTKIAGTVFRTRTDGGYDLLDGHLESTTFLFVPSSITTNSTKITTSLSNCYNLLIPEVGYLDGNGTATVTITSACGQKLNLVFNRGKAEERLDVSPSLLTLGYQSGSATFSIKAYPDHCGWSMVSKPSWVTSITPSRGDNDAKIWEITANYEENAGAARSGYIVLRHTQNTAITRQVQVVQNADTRSLSVSPTSLSFASGGGSASVLAVAGGPSGAAWTVVSKPSWIALSSTSGVNTNVTVTCAANTGSVRSDYITFRHNQNTSLTRTVAVSQAGIGLSVSPTALSFGSAGGRQTVTVNASSWAMSSKPSWVTVSPSSGTNTVSVGISCTSNENATATTSTRSGTVVFYHRQNSSLTRSVTVYQAGHTYDPGIMILAAVPVSQANTCPAGYRVPRFRNDYTEQFRQALIAINFVNRGDGFMLFGDKWRQNSSVKVIWMQCISNCVGNWVYTDVYDSSCGGWLLPSRTVKYDVTNSGYASGNGATPYLSAWNWTAIRVCLKTSQWGN